MDALPAALHGSLTEDAKKYIFMIEWYITTSVSMPTLLLLLVLAAQSVSADLVADDSVLSLS